MPTYTVHAPPQAADAALQPERFAFVRDGFHVGAFLVAPLWMIYRRMWLVLLAYLVGIAAVYGLLMLVGVGLGARSAAGLLVALLIGLEAGALRRWSLGRRRWTALGLATGDTLEEAERRFFGRWTTARPAAAPRPAIPARSPIPHVAGQDVLGVFPQPERPGSPR